MAVTSKRHAALERLGPDDRVGALDNGRRHALLDLQRHSGNAAVTVVVQRLGPKPTPFTPADNVIAAADSGIRTDLGDTTFGPGTPPSLEIDITGSGGWCLATPFAGAAGAPNIVARYPSPGLYPVGRSASGTVYGIVSRELSAVVRAGEQEHADDADLAQRRVYNTISQAVARVAGARGVSSRDERTARANCLASLNHGLPPRMRFSGESAAAAPAWRGAVAALMASTVQRDTNRWHSMTTRRATYQESLPHNAQLGMGDALVMVVEGGEIGKHPSPAFIEAAYKSRFGAS